MSKVLIYFFQFLLEKSTNENMIDKVSEGSTFLKGTSRILSITKPPDYTENYNPDVSISKLKDVLIKKGSFKLFFNKKSGLDYPGFLKFSIFFLEFLLYALNEFILEMIDLDSRILLNLSKN